MTVSELIERLRELPQSYRVVLETLGGTAFSIDRADRVQLNVKPTWTDEVILLGSPQASLNNPEVVSFSTNYGVDP